MQKAKKRLLITGCTLIAVTVMLILYVVLLGMGVISGRQQNLVLQAGTAEKAYDGEPLVCEEWTLLRGELKEGHTVVPLFKGNQLAPGQSANQMTARIEDENGVDVSDEYVIEYVDGVLSVYTTELTIAANDKSWEYNGLPLQATSSDWSLVEGSVRLGHEIRATLNASLSEVGTCESTVTARIYDQDGKDVTHQYHIEYVAGTLELKPRSLSMYSASGEKYYDGTPIEQGDAVLMGGSLLSGHTLQTIFPESITDVGTVENAFSILVTDEEGKDVTDLYRMIPEFGTLTIEARPVTIRSASAKKKYTGDGVALTGASAQIVEGFLAPIHRLSCDFTGSQMEIGSSPNTFTVDILDKNGNSVISNYAVTLETGTLTVVEFVVDDGSSTDPDPAVNSGINNGGGAPDSDLAVLNFQATVAGPVYLRVQSFGEYMNFGWEASPAVPEGLGDYNPLLWIGSVLAARGEELQQLELQWLLPSPGYAVPYYADSLPVSGAEDSFIRWGTQTQSVGFYSFDLLESLLDGQDSLALDPTLAAAEAVYREFVYDNFLSIPSEELRNVMLEHIRQGRISPQSESVIRDVANYIQGAAEYDLEAQEAPAGMDPIIYFLNHSRRGVCRHYASAAVMMYRALGIPARYVVGYMGISNAGELTTVTADRGHAWVEVYIDGLGWMPVEVTGGSSVIPPESERIPIHVRPEDAFGVANGTSYGPTDFRLFGDLLEGHEFVGTLDGSLDTPGHASSTIGSFAIIDSLSGADMTHLYDVITHPGNIRVVETEEQLKELMNSLCLFIRPQSVFDMANGQTLRATDWEYVTMFSQGNWVVVGDQLRDNHQLTCTYGGELSLPGEAVSTILSYRITDTQTGEDVTDQYYVICQEGLLRLEPSDRYIVIKPLDVYGPYNGEIAYAPTLTDWEYGVNSDYLQYNHELQIHEMKGSLTNVGSSHSIITDYSIVDNHTGEDVTHLYNVLRQPGRIDVVAHIIIKPKDVQERYNGKEHTASEWEYVPGSIGRLLPGHEITTCTFTGSLVSVGITESQLEVVRITDTRTGEDVTDRYRIERMSGWIEVINDPIDITIKPVDIQKIFDGKVYSPEKWEFVGEPVELMDGHTLYCIYDGSMQFPIIPDGEYASDDEYFEATKCDTYIVDWYVEDEEGNVVDRMGIGYWYNVTTEPGYISLMSLEFTIDPMDVEILYDKKYHAANDADYKATAISYVMGSRDWLDQYTLKVDLNGGRTQHGKTPITVGEVRVYNADGEDMTNGFQINKKEGTMHIYSDRLTFRTGSAEKSYDGKPLINEDWEHIGGRLLPGHTLTVETYSGLTNVGTATNTPILHIKNNLGEDVTDWYILDTAHSQLGRLTVHKMRLGVRSQDAEDFFVPGSGNVLTCHEIEIIEGSVAEGEVVEAEITGSQSSVGYSENTIRWEKIRIKDAAGKDTTHNYDIYAVSGTLTMKPPRN